MLRWAALAVLIAFLVIASLASYMVERGGPPLVAGSILWLALVLMGVLSGWLWSAGGQRSKRKRQVQRYPDYGPVETEKPKRKNDWALGDDGELVEPCLPSTMDQ